MAVEAISGKKSNLLRPVSIAEKNPAEVSEKENLQAESKKPAEIMLFASKTKYSQEAPKVTTGSKPVAESSQAAVASARPAPALFQMNESGRIVAATAHANAAPTILASALTGAENNKGSGDKKDGGRNAFISATKKTQDLRQERLEALTALENTNFLSMTKGLC